MAIRKRTWTNKDGSTSERWFCYYTRPDGKRQAKSFDLYREAVKFESQVRVDIGKGTFVTIDARATVDQAGARWIENCKAKQLRRVTLKQYESHLEKHISPRLGAVKLGNLDHDRCTGFRNDLLRDLSDSMAAKVWTSFKSLLKTVRMSHLVDGIELAAPRAAELTPGVDLPTLAEMPRILAAAEPGRQRAMFILLAFCGLRSGELRALRWSDLSGAVVSVNRGVDEWGGFDDPKSNKSRRKLDMPPAAIEHLQTWKMASPYSKDTDLVFPNRGETRPGEARSHKVVADEVRAVLRRAAVTVDGSPTGETKYSGLHQFRHWFASWSLYPREMGGRGAGLGEVSRLMGHASQAVTEQRYGHWFPGHDNAERFAADTAKMLAGL